MQALFYLVGTLIATAFDKIQFRKNQGLIIHDDAGTLKINASNGTDLAEVHVATPTSGDAAATKDYVDGVASPYALKAYKIAFSGGASASGTATLSAGSTIHKITVKLTQALTGVNPTLEVGTTGTADAFVAGADFDAARANTTVFDSSPVGVGGSAVTPKVTLTNAGGAGAGEVWIYYTTQNNQ